MLQILKAEFSAAMSMSGMSNWVYGNITKVYISLAWGWPIYTMDDYTHICYSIILKKAQCTVQVLTEL